MIDVKYLEDPQSFAYSPTTVEQSTQNDTPSVDVVGTTTHYIMLANVQNGLPDGTPGPYSTIGKKGMGVSDRSSARPESAANPELAKNPNISSPP